MCQLREHLAKIFFSSPLYVHEFFLARWPCARIFFLCICTCRIFFFKITHPPPPPPPPQKSNGRPLTKINMKCLTLNLNLHFNTENSVDERLLTREAFWSAQLCTLMPRGLNKRFGAQFNLTDFSVVKGLMLLKDIMQRLSKNRIRHN